MKKMGTLLALVGGAAVAVSAESPGTTRTAAIENPWSPNQSTPSGTDRRSTAAAGSSGGRPVSSSGRRYPPLVSWRTA